MRVGYTWIFVSNLFQRFALWSCHQGDYCYLNNGMSIKTPNHFIDLNLYLNMVNYITQPATWESNDVLRCDNRIVIGVTKQIKNPHILLYGLSNCAFHTLRFCRRLIQVRCESSNGFRLIPYNVCPSADADTESFLTCRHRSFVVSTQVNSSWNVLLSFTYWLMVQWKQKQQWLDLPLLTSTVLITRAS